jgi:NADH-quinone oxidoreductase subunit H
LAETNRVPFDLPEAESEWVSGYNVEYSSIGFTFFFLAEYSNIILMSSIIVILFLGGWLPFFNLFFFKYIYTSFWFSIKLLLIMFFFVWVRATLPRYRYDQLMMLGWKVILPLSLGFCFLSIFLFLLFI